LIVHDGYVFCTDDAAKVKISAWPMMEPGDHVVVKGGDLQGESGACLEFGGIPGDAPRRGLQEPDGKWELELKDGRSVRVDLCHVKPFAAGKMKATHSEANVVAELESEPTGKQKTNHKRDEWRSRYQSGSSSLLMYV
jgi:hypothetical protein